MHLNTLEERKERRDIITIYKLTNNLEETDRKDLILRRKGEARNLRTQEIKRNLLERYKKVQFSPKKYRYLEWTERRGDNGKECTKTEGKTGQT